MFYIHSTTNKITLTQGDNAEMVVNVYDAKGKERGVFADDTVTLTVKSSLQAPVALSKTAINGVFVFTPEDTINLAPGNYVYDVELKTFTGKTYTIVPVSQFCLKEDVTR